MVDKIIKTYGGKEQIIIGYNEGWKNNVNIGKKIMECFIQYHIKY